MKTQIVYQTNLDYEASYRKLAESNLVVADKTEKGLIWIRFKDTKTIFIISPNGKIQVLWKSPGEKKILLNLIRNLLVTEEGQKLQMEPTMQQLSIPYPPPSTFKLFWCDEETEYTKKGFGFLDWLERGAERRRLEHERERRELKAAALAHFRYRAEVDGVRFWKYIVDEEDRMNKIRSE